MDIYGYVSETFVPICLSCYKLTVVIAPWACCGRCHAFLFKVLPDREEPWDLIVLWEERVAWEKALYGEGDPAEVRHLGSPGPSQFWVDDPWTGPPIATGAEPFHGESMTAQWEEQSLLPSTIKWLALSVMVEVGVEASCGTQVSEELE